MPLTDSLVSFYELEEASGTRVDSHGTHDLTDTNTVTQTAGLVGNCAVFTSANSEKLNVAHHADFNGSTDFSIAGWFYLTTIGAVRALVTKWSSAASFGPYQLIYESIAGRFMFRLGNSSIDGYAASVYANTHAASAGSPATATWYFIYCYHDAINSRAGIAVNTVYDTTTTTDIPFDSTEDFVIGGYNSGAGYLNGRADQVGFWRRTLTPNEVTTLYNGGSGISYATLSGGGGGGTSTALKTVTQALFAGGGI
jgi:hypothetical protein